MLAKLVRLLKLVTSYLLTGGKWGCVESTARLRLAEGSLSPGKDHPPGSSESGLSLSEVLQDIVECCDKECAPTVNVVFLSYNYMDRLLMLTDICNGNRPYDYLHSLGIIRFKNGNRVMFHPLIRDWSTQQRFGGMDINYLVVDGDMDKQYVHEMLNRVGRVTDSGAPLKAYQRQGATFISLIKPKSLPGSKP